MTTRTWITGWMLALAGLASCGDGAQAPAEPGAPEPDGVAGVAWADWETTPSGLQYFVVEEGKGDRRARQGDEVTVHYTGTFPDGRIFDSSRRTGQPFKFPLGFGKVIPGWDEGVALMREGSRYKLRVPYQLAYGEQGDGGRIPPRQDLLFDIEVLRVRTAIEIADFPPRDERREVRLDSGLAYEVLEEGDATKGPPVRDGVALKIAYSLWTEGGKFVMNSQMRGAPGRPEYVIGECGKLHIGGNPLKFLQEAGRVMAPGGSYRFTVPADLCWGDNVTYPGLDKGAPTVWRLDLLETVAIPPFVMPDFEKAITTDSGLRYEVLKEGSGPSPRPADRVRVHYSGCLTDGTRFDSSYARFEPAVFPVNRVIPGWQELLQRMSPGMIVRAFIPAELAYGSRPPPSSGIPANAPLVFQVELLEVVR